MASKEYNASLEKIPFLFPGMGEEKGEKYSLDLIFKHALASDAFVNHIRWMEQFKIEAVASVQHDGLLHGC